MVTTHDGNIPQPYPLLLTRSIVPKNSAARADMSPNEAAHLDEFLGQRDHDLYKRRLLNTQAIQGTMERICPRERVRVCSLF